MLIAISQIDFWEEPYYSTVGDYRLLVGDQVVIKTEWGTEIGKITAIREISEQELREKELLHILRKVTTEDLEKMDIIRKDEAEALIFCKKTSDRYELPMKIISAHFSFDGTRLIFPFIADSRIDFRQLVKDLTHHFQKSIRLQQIGIRDEARIAGDIGSCGRALCCRTHLKELASITSDLADVQQIAHRGSERLSGQCGRLRCCLAFEGLAYQELAKNLPAIGSTVKTQQGNGEVVYWHILKQTVDVAIAGQKDNIIEIPVAKLK